MSSRPLNILHVCDHLGWEGSRMHGVKRLFGWMIPRFDPSRFRVSLVSLRKKDVSEETLEAQGIDITYLRRSKFDPLTLPDLLKVIDRQQIDVLHLHGYGATTFGRVAAAARGIPAILHEHANLTDTPWFQKVADKMLEPYTDIALAVSRSTAEFVIAGFRRDVPATLSAFDLSVFPSLWEGTPLTAFEALGMGKPIVATDADGLLDILTRDHDALIVPRRDAAALAERVVWAMDR